MVCTTGSISLSATATGYNRAAGSFVTDGLVVGQEITPAGFAANTVDTLTAVTATDLTVRTARAVEAVAGGRTISVELPALRAWENVDLIPVTGRPYLEEDYVPATNTLITLPAFGGQVQEDGLYVLKVYGPTNVGVSALRKTVDALKALFAPGTAITAGSNVVRVRTDTSVQTGQVIPIASGFACLVLTVPWRARSANVIAP